MFHPALIYMKHKIYILVFVMSTVLCSAQTQSMMFERTWGSDWAMYTNRIDYIDQQSNGDYFMIGIKSTTFWGDYQYYMCRTDSVGSILWEQIWGVADGSTSIAKVLKLSDETYIAVGRGVSGMGGGIGDLSASRIEANGNILFNKYYDFSYDDGAYDIIPTYDDCFIISGSKGTGPGDAVPAFVKIDINGNEIWRRSYSTLVEHRPLHISETADHGFVVVGQMYNSSAANVYYSKFDSLGMMQWIKYPFGQTDTFINRAGTIKGNADGTFDIFYDLDRTVGIPAEYVSAQLVHYNDQGDTIWTKSYNDPIGLFRVREIDSVFCCSIGANQMLGVINSNYGFDAKTTGVTGNHYLNCYNETHDGGYVACGYSQGTNGTTKFYFVKFGPDGRYQASPFVSHLLIGPNPSLDGNITVSFDVQTEENIQIRVLSMEGRLVYYDELFCPANSHTELPIDVLGTTTAAGLYILEIKTSTEFRRVKLVIGREGSN